MAIQRLIAALAAALALLLGAPAEARDRLPPLSAADVQAMNLASSRGTLIYAYDQAAWHGSDAMMAKLPDARSKVGGWIVDGPADSPELVFFDRDPATPHALFVADFKDGKLASSRIPPAGEEIGAERRRLIAARAAAIEAFQAKGLGRCSESPMNSVVLPPRRPDEPIYVYLLTPQTDGNVIPFGGHYRATVGADGKVSEIRPFTNSCIAMPLKPPKGPKPVALMITHLLDDVPTEIHVFSSWVAHMPVMVGTRDGRIWAVNRGLIAIVGEVKR